MVLIRRAVLIGIPRFGDATPPWDPLPFAAQRVDDLAEALRRFGYDCRIPAAGTMVGPAMRQAVLDAASGLGRDDLLIVHVLSHGEPTEEGRLVVIDAAGQVDRDNNDVNDWLRVFTENHALPSTLFLIDCCYAGSAVRQHWQLTRRPTRGRAWGLAACGESDLAFDGRFTQAVVNVLHRFATSEAVAGTQSDHVQLNTVAPEISRELRCLVDAGVKQEQLVHGSLLDLAQDPPSLPFFPNPHHRPAGAVPQPVRGAGAAQVDVDEGMDPRHFIRAASGLGGPAADDAGCFRGRTTELVTLTEWFAGHDTARVRVVTGSAGAGKSAIIGMLVCAAHPALRQATRHVWSRADGMPQAHPRLAAVHARQRSLPEVVASVARQLGHRGPGHDLRTARELLAALREAEDPPVVVIDALDEAVGHEELLNGLVLPLATADRADGRPVCRLLVGMRKWPEFAPLTELAATVDLDDVDTTRLRRDLEDYVSDLLRRHEPYDDERYVAARQRFARAVAGRLTGEAHRANPDRWGEFLIAGLYANHFLASPAPVDDQAEAARIGEAVPHALPDVFELDLAGRPGAPQLRAVLAALSYAHGDGMPALTLRQATAAFSGTDSPLDWPVVAAALDEGSFYLRRSADTDGTPLFRLFHQGLADHLQRHPVAAGSAEPPEAGATRMLRAMLNPLGMAPGGRRWDTAEPYLLRHAAALASSPALHDDLEFLVHADPDDCTGVPVTWLSRDRWTSAAARPDRRRQLLALEAAGNDRPDAARSLCRPPGRPPLAWQPIWRSAAATTVRHIEELRMCVLGHRDGRVEVRDWSGRSRPGTDILRAQPSKRDGGAARFVLRERPLLAGAAAGDAEQLVVREDGPDGQELLRFPLDAPIVGVTASAAGHLAVMTGAGVVFFEQALAPPAARRAVAVKVFLGGGFGAGKTTAVGAVSEVTPVVTEAMMTVMSVGVDDISLLPHKTTTTAVLDHGRITLAEDVTVYVFGAGGQPRKWPMWDDLVRGSAGAVALVDTRRIEDAFPTVDYLERVGVPFVVAINCFDGVEHHTVDEVRAALDLPPGTPVVACDARYRASVLDVLTCLLEHVLRPASDQRAAPTHGATVRAVTGHAR